MKRIFYLLTLSGLIASCSSSKFDYNNAYQFSTHRTVKQQTVVEDNPILIASRSTSIGQVPVIPERLPLVNPQQIKRLSKKEKQGLIKEIKQIGKNLKRLRKEDPARAEIESQKATKALTGKTYAGAVIGIAGLILLILNIASPLGVLAFVVGLALVAWGLIERGSL